MGGNRSGKQEYWGDFWLEDKPTQRVPGHLTFHPTRGGELLLHSTLEADARITDHRSYDRILGTVLGKACVLLDCFDYGRSSAEARPGEWEVNTRIFVNGIVLAPRQHADGPSERFVAASASFEGLAEFDGRMPFKFEHDVEGEDKAERVAVIGLEPRAIETSQATIEFLQGTGSKGGEYKSHTLLSRHFMRVSPRRPRPLDELIDLYVQSRTLIAIAMHQDCRFDGPILLQPEPRPDDNPGAYLAPYEYHARWLRGRRHRLALYNRVLSYDSLGPEGIAGWLELEGECGHVVSRLSSLRYTKGIAYEDALLRVVAAADSLHRVIFPRDQRTKSRTMLRELADYASYPFRSAVVDIDAWAHAVITERDNAAHNKGLVVSSPALTTQLVESVYFLVLVGLLRRADAPDSAFEGLRHSQPFLWPMKDVFWEFGGDDWGRRMGKSRGTLGG